MTLQCCVAQLNYVVGDMDGNAQKIIDLARQAHERGVGLVLTPELALCGYAAEDLFLRPSFIAACDDALRRIARELADLKDLAVVVGHPVGEGERSRSVSVARRYNRASVVRGGDIIATYDKRELPNYQVFDERRYFRPGQEATVFEHAGVRIGLLICEDAWFEQPAADCLALGAQCLAVINASPFHVGKGNERELAMAARCQQTGLPLIYAHLVGGQDEVVFEGRSFALDADGRMLAIRFDDRAELGAYPAAFGPYIATKNLTITMGGVYRIPAMYARTRLAYTNAAPVSAYRGAGRPEAAYNLERLVDFAARELGMKPEALRRKNFIAPSAMPYKTPIGDRVYDTGDFDQHLTQALSVSQWDGFKARLKESKKNGKLRGIGLATYIECTAWGDGEDVLVQLEQDGTVTVFSGTQSNGQGHATAYAQFASQHLDLPLDKIKVVQGDTARVATGHGTGGSRSIPVGGVSTFVAGRLKSTNSRSVPWIRRSCSSSIW